MSTDAIKNYYYICVRELIFNCIKFEFCLGKLWVYGGIVFFFEKNSQSAVIEGKFKIHIFTCLRNKFNTRVYYVEITGLFRPTSILCNGKLKI